MRAIDDTAPLVASEGDGGSETAGALEPGKLFARYLVVDAVGSGGVGSVYAVYDPNLDRRIALKVLRQRDPSSTLHDSLATTDAQRQLVKEAKALASLSHPNVVTVYDVGQHEGRTFIAMELVDGEDLSSWLGQHDGTQWRDKLRMLIDAGKGLASAHDRGVLHRDFKPANVLVGKDGWVRVSDFGLARLLEPGHAQQSQPTIDTVDESISLDASVSVPGRLVGTPYYMAPEQMNGEAGVRSDIYAFCLSVHEALYEERPFAGTTLASLAASKLDGPPAAPADTHGVPLSVRKAIERGLQPDPGQRWESMTELLSELEGALAQRRTSWAPWVVGLTAIASAAAVIAVDADESCTGGELKLEPVWNNARRQRVADAFGSSEFVFGDDAFARSAPALDQFASSWSDAHRSVCEATRRSEQSESMLDRKMICLDRRLLEFSATVDVLEEAKRKAVERAPSIAASLPDLAACVAPRSADDLQAVLEPQAQEVEGLLAQADARTAAGLYPDADPISQEALTRAQDVGSDRLLADALYRRGVVHNKMGRIDSAVEALEQAAWTAQRAGYGLGMIQAASLLASVEGSRAAKPDAGLRWSRYAQAQIEHSGAPASSRATLLNNVGMVYDSAGELDKARVSFEEALELMDDAGLDDPDRRAGLYDNVGIVQRRAGKYDSAVASHLEALKIREALLGQEHPLLARTLSNLATALTETGKFDEAIDIHMRSLAIREKVLGPDHLDVSITLNNLGAVYYRRGSSAEAEAVFQRALKIREALLPADHPKVVSALGNIALILEGRGELDEAGQLYEEALGRIETGSSPAGQALSTLLSNLGNLRAAQERIDEAAELYERSLALDEASLGSDHPMVAVSLTNLGNMREEQGRYEDARALHQRALKVREDKLGPQHPDLIWTLSGLSGSYQAQGRPQQAIEPLQRALSIAKVADVDPILVAGVRFDLAQAVWDVQRDRTRARQLAVAARESFEKTGTNATEVAAVDAFLARVRSSR